MTIISNIVIVLNLHFVNIQTRLLGGANVIVKVGDGNISALLFGLANIVTHVGDGDNYAIHGDIDIAIAIFSDNIQTAK
jgi:hypothetical protein